MPSRKGTEQALVWLKSKMAEKDTLDAINAEICYNVILDLRDRKRAIGAMYHQTKEQLDKEREKLYSSTAELTLKKREEMMKLYWAAIETMMKYGGYTDGDI